MLSDVLHANLTLWSEFDEKKLVLVYMNQTSVEVSRLEDHVQSNWHGISE